MNRHFRFAGLLLAAVILLLGCGGGGGNGSSATTALTVAQIQNLTPADIAKFKQADIEALGKNIKELSNSALAALSYVTYAIAPTTGSGQVGFITAEQIVVLSPAQVRQIGAATTGGAHSSDKGSASNIISISQSRTPSSLLQQLPRATHAATA